jgi:hypothetical protein
MWEPQPLRTLRASKACRGETLPFTFYRSQSLLVVKFNYIRECEELQKSQLQLVPEVLNRLHLTAAERHIQGFWHYETHVLISTVRTVGTWSTEQISAECCPEAYPEVLTLRDACLSIYSQNATEPNALPALPLERTTVLSPLLCTYAYGPTYV